MVKNPRLANYLDYWAPTSGPLLEECNYTHEPETYSKKGSKDMLLPLRPFINVPGTDGPSREELTPLMGTLSAELVPVVPNYLRLCPHFLVWMEYTRDVINDSFGVSGGSAVVSDGHYYWRLDAADYVATYGIGLPDDFIRRGLEQRWQPPVFDDKDWFAIYDELIEASRAR